MTDKPTKVVGRRVVAFIVDGVLVGAVNLALFFAFAGDPTTAGLDPDRTIYGNLELGDRTYSVYGGTAVAYFLLALAVWLGYYVVWQGRSGATLGKRMLGIRVVRDDGSGAPPGVWRALARTFLSIADGFPYVIPYLTGFVVALASRDHKRIGDMVASTLVVRKDAARPAAP